MNRWIVGLALALSPTVGNAQWTPSGNGEYAFTDNITFSGAAYSCDIQASWMLSGSCSASASGITLEHQGGTAQIAFVGLTTPVVFTNLGGPPVKIGALSVSLSGGLFTWPDDRVVSNLFSMRIVGTAGARTSSLSMGFYRASPTEMLSNSNYSNRSSMHWPLGSQSPSGGSYLGALEDINYPTLFAGQSATYDLYLRPTMAPEPSTYALMAAGLLAIGAVTRRRRA